ncbi:hypothetical protein [Frankia canadensis]|uniref:hypothetical protein n=1 Tax=Frankia canadensis TaxID=1836972 RepID=UPI0014038C27|nr:hypothetical protein [Frankia canadensis]
MPSLDTDRLSGLMSEEVGRDRRAACGGSGRVEGDPAFDSVAAERPAGDGGAQRVAGIPGAFRNAP